jgi:hypothetical protein
VIIQNKLESLQKPKDLSLANARDHEWYPKSQLWHQCIPCLKATGSTFGEGLTMGHICGFCHHFGSRACEMKASVKYSNDNKNKSWQPIKRVAQPSDSLELGIDVLPFNFPKLNDVALNFRYFEGAFDCSPRWFLVQTWKGELVDQEPLAPICPQSYNLLLDRAHQEKNFLTWAERMRRRAVHHALDLQAQRDNVLKAKAILSHSKRAKQQAKERRKEGVCEYEDDESDFEYDDDDGVD